ncbi:RNA polymerase sigma factor [Croceiramulus getboli]|nr:sigma factor-like helix-turn-helix DNA-binding protein [Flavobacteriaceae bacterium YJPT1-3]
MSSPETDSQQSELQWQLLYHCIEKLDPLNKTILLLSLEKTPQKEIATIVGLSHEAVRVKMHRIKKELIQCTQHEKL